MVTIFIFDGVALQPSHKFKFAFDHWPVSVSREEPWSVTRKRDYMWSKSENGTNKTRLTEITENWSKFERKWRACDIHGYPRKGLKYLYCYLSYCQKFD